MKRSLVTSFLIAIFTLSSIVNAFPTTSFYGAMPHSANDFISKSCNKTSYADTCNHSLQPFAAVVGQNIYKLSKIAVKVSLTMTRQLKPVSKNYGSGKVTKSAFSDCTSLFDDSIDEISDSLDRMKQGGSGGMASMLSDVETWMGAALTNLDTCSDGLQDVANGPVKSSVVDAVGKATEYTSNALALVEQIGGSI